MEMRGNSMVRIHSNRQQDLFDKTEMNIVFDIDGTLSNDDWRRKLSERDECGKVDWDKYHSEGKHDLPIYSLCAIYRAFAASGFGMILITGRPIKYKQATKLWLDENEIVYHNLFMRPENDYSSNDKLKLRLLSENGLTPSNVISVFDDNERVIALLRDYGYVTFQVAIV